MFERRFATMSGERQRTTSFRASTGLPPVRCPRWPWPRPAHPACALDRDASAGESGGRRLPSQPGTRPGRIEDAALTAGGGRAGW